MPDDKSARGIKNGGRNALRSVSASIVNMVEFGIRCLFACQRYGEVGLLACGIDSLDVEDRLLAG